MRYVFAALLYGLIPAISVGQERSPAVSVLLHESFLYYHSTHVTVAGFGGGPGLLIELDGRFILQADIMVGWGNGNAIPVRMAAGMQRVGTWCRRLPSRGRCSVVSEPKFSMTTDVVRLHPIGAQGSECVRFVFAGSMGPFHSLNAVTPSDPTGARASSCL